MKELERWDNYFRTICIAIATKSPCLSRKIGAILVKDKSIIATGYNGPPRGYWHCGEERFENDDHLSNEIREITPFPSTHEIHNTCPRRILCYKSGEGLEWCPAEHAERNCIANAARMGVSTVGSTLYMNCIMPCKNCLSLLINAGIRMMVVDSDTFYDKQSIPIYEKCTILARTFGSYHIIGKVLGVRCHDTNT